MRKARALWRKTMVLREGKDMGSLAAGRARATSIGLLLVWWRRAFARGDG